MNLRFLTVAALAGMLLAACGGGGGTQTSGLTPTTPGTNTSPTQSGNRASFSVSFQVPIPSGSTTSSSSRTPQYVSPGSTGLQVVLSKDGVTTPTFAIGTQAAPLALAPTPAGGITANLNTGAYGVTGTGAPFTAGTAQLSGNITEVAVGTVYNANTVPGSATVTPVVGQTLVITNAAAQTLTGTVKTVSGTAGTGFLMTITETATSAGASAYTTGNIINFQAGSTSQSTYTYTFTPMTNNAAGSGANGYYQATITFNNMTGGQNYVVGVVLTDLATAGNPILSEAQTPITAVAAQGATSFATLSLQPVVWGVFIPTPTVQTLAQTTADGAPVNSFESTVFLTDERGYVIPNQASAPAIDNGAAVTITSTNVGGLTLGLYGAYTQLAATTTSITTPPTTNTYAAGAVVINTLGTLFGNYNLPTAPLSLTLNGAGTTPQITNVNGVGTPLALTCASTGTQTLTAKMTSVTPATVGGYTYVAGTNVPTVASTALTSATSTSIGSMNCNPSIVLPIN